MGKKITIESLRVIHECLMNLDEKRIDKLQFHACIRNYREGEGRLLDRPSLTYHWVNEPEQQQY